MGSDDSLFRRQLLRNPRQMSAIAPSSRTLGRAMAVGLGPHSGRIVEFGGGTGRLTQAILETGVRPGHLTVFELDPELADHLRATLPAAVTVLTDGAQTAPHHITPGVEAVISGLPLLSMPESLRHDIVGAAMAILAPEGRMVQFTYGPRPPISAPIAEQLNIDIRKGPRVLRNLPPARIYEFRPKRPANR